MLQLRTSGGATFDIRLRALGLNFMAGRDRFGSVDGVLRMGVGRRKKRK